MVTNSNNITGHSFWKKNHITYVAIVCKLVKVKILVPYFKSVEHLVPSTNKLAN